MKLKKIFAGMAASAIAMTTFAMGTAPAASADAAVTGNAGITFQTDGNYTYRDMPGETGPNAVFPNQQVGCAGGANGFSDISCGDIEINGSGSYTVTIPTSGIINVEPDLAKPANKKAWWIDEEKGVNRMDSKWSMLGSYEPPESEEEDAPIPEKSEWELSAGNTQFNMLGISTDIPCFYDEDSGKCYLDEAMTQEITVSNVSVDMPGAGTFTGDVGVFKTDVKDSTVSIAVINNYAPDASAGVGSVIDPTAFLTEDGEISISFDINFAEASNDSTESNESGTESGDSNASGSDSNASSSSSSSSSKGGNGNGGGNGGSKGGTTKTETAESLADSASDATENAKSGAPAGIALALAAVAGAVVVVSRKKN
ncbi:MAG: hypothetical protein K6C68_02320 [Ruminococcus sp.]|nr:hypothetical protein [Ruminococcus sp.]